MKQMLFLLVAMSSLAVRAQQPAPCLRLSKIEAVEHVLYQNGVTQAELTFEGKNCHVFVGSAGHDLEQPVFKVQREPGLDIRVEMTRTSHLDQATVGARIYRAQQISVVLSLRASPDLTLGEHRLPGTVHYRIMDGLGNISDETLAFTVPIKVEPPKVYLPEAPFSERHPIWSKVLLPLEVIAFIPMYILASLMGWDGC